MYVLVVITWLEIIFDIRKGKPIGAFSFCNLIVVIFFYHGVYSKVYGISNMI